MKSRRVVSLYAFSAEQQIFDTRYLCWMIERFDLKVSNISWVEQYTFQEAFAPFINKMYATRLEAKRNKHTLLSNTCKLFLNVS